MSSNRKNTKRNSLKSRGRFSLTPLIKRLASQINLYRAKTNPSLLDPIASVPQGIRWGIKNGLLLAAERRRIRLAPSIPPAAQTHRGRLMLTEQRAPPESS